MSGDAGADAALRWGVPDWRDATAYPGSTTTLMEWWWQFTRRHPDYRALWLDAAPRQAAFVEKRDRSEMATWASLLEMPVDQYIERQRDTPPLDDVGSQRRFRIFCTLNPTKSFDEDFLQHYFRGDGIRLSATGQDEGVRVFISFNLKKPLDRQIEDARSLLEEQRDNRELPKVVHRPRKANWVRFLRALDAREIAGVTYSEMAATFWPGQEKKEQAARDTYERACELREYFPL